MRLLVIAVGSRTPRWVDEAFQDYARRMPHELRLDLVQIRPEPRAAGRTTQALLAAEAQRIARALPPRARRVVLDERGREFTSLELSRWLERERLASGTLAFLIGGPDGLAEDIRHGAHLRLRLSSLTLPHALVRVVLAEQLYRASAILSGHPYHRE